MLLSAGKKSRLQTVALAALGSAGGFLLSEPRGTLARRIGGGARHASRWGEQGAAVMFKTRSRWTSAALAVAIAAMVVPTVAQAGPRNSGLTPSKPAKEVVRAQKAVQKMARQQENAARAAAKRAAAPTRSVAAPPPAESPRNAQTSRSRSFTTNARPDRTSRSGSAYSGSCGSYPAYSKQGYPKSGSPYAYSGSKHKGYNGYKGNKGYGYKNDSKSSFSFSIGYSSCGSVGHVCSSACYGFRYSYGRPYGYGYSYPYRYRYGYYGSSCGPSYAWTNPYWCYRPPFAYCPPTTIYAYGYPSTRYGLTSVDYYPSGGGVTTWQSPASGASGDYYAWQREVATDTTNQPGTVAAMPERAPLDGEPVSPAPSGDLLADAWAALAAGDDKTALGYFSTVADSAPELVQPKVGYAIAAASQGSIKPAAWSLRRAWTQSPDSIGYLPTDKGMIERLDKLAADLQRRAIAGEGTADLWFIAATVDFLRFQPAEAKAAADRARILGDQHPSLDALTRRLEADLVGQ